MANQQTRPYKSYNVSYSRTRAPSPPPEAVDYMATWPSIARVGFVFIVPVHPAPPPVAVGTAAAISIALRTYAEALDDVALYNNLRAALTSQILSAVNPSFLSALEDPDFGFGDVTPFAMLEHLRGEYGTMTPEELERNRNALSEPWNLDDPIEDLWSKIANIQRVATLGALPIPDLTVITLTRKNRTPCHHHRQIPAATDH